MNESQQAIQRILNGASVLDLIDGMFEDQKFRSKLKSVKGVLGLKSGKALWTNKTKSQMKMWRSAHRMAAKKETT